MNIVIENNLVIDKKQTRSINFFWWGFIIYMMAFILSRTNFLNHVFFQALQLLGLLLFTRNASRLTKFNVESTYFKNLFFLYFVWSLIVVVRGLSSDYDTIKRILFNSDVGIFAYFAPLIAFFPLTLQSYKKLFDTIFILSIFFILLDMVFIRQMLNSDRTDIIGKGFVETFAGELAIPCCFVMLTYSYHSKFRNLFALGIILLSLFFAIWWGRRGLIFICGTPLLLSYILYLFAAKTKLLIIFLSAIMILVGAVYGSEIYNKGKKKVFNVLVERADEDTRSGVEYYFYHDMDSKDWAIGRGMNGEYYCPGIQEDSITDNRDVIETGYLQIILKGGIISLGLYLLIAMPAVINGIFYSKNILSKAAGIWVFLSVINLYPTTINIFSMQYLLVWISIGICYSKVIREIPEDKMREYFEAPSA